ncbi:DNA polymerase I [Candidatus Azambacteria bacterium]|nr:DNA polymerase I [Candidatus Azambacteria bacterium]
MKKFILIDAYALIHRAYHALPPLSSKSGESVNAVFGFSSILIKTIGEFKPDYIAAAFDLPEPTFRHKEYGKYKATRPEAPPDLYIQIPRVKEILAAFEIPVYEKSGYEADDIIGTVSRKLSGKDIEVFILTGDMDTLQLVCDNIKVYTPKRGLSDPVIYDAKKVGERFEGLSPEQMPDFKGLKGDPSDNIPGVKGIGEKTAINLLNRYKTIEKLYEAVESGRVGGIGKSVLEKLKAGKEAAFFSKKLAILDTNVPIDFSLEKSAFGKFDKEKIFEVFRELGFMSLIERLKSAGEQGVLAMPLKIAERIEYKKVPRDLSLEKLIGELKTAKEIYLAHQIENGNLKALAINPVRSKVSNGVNDGKSIYLLENDFSSVAEIISGKKIKKIGCDLKSLIKAFWKKNMDFYGLEFDAEIAAYVLNPGERDYGIEKLIMKEFGESVPENPDESLAFKANVLKKLESALLARLAATETERVFKEIEMPLIPVLAKMETIGIGLDGESLKKTAGELKNKLEGLEKEIYDLAGEKFNINSPRQLAEIIFVKLKIPGARSGGRIKKTPGGALSTSAGELEKLRGEHKIIDYILKYRELAKLKSTYADALPNLVDKIHRIHTTFNQTGTATGRLSSQDPNLQNIPARGDFSGDIRRAFAAESGFKFLSVDYSQIHLRIIAALAGDKKMIKAFKDGLDIHKFTAAEINNVSIEKVTPEMRFAAKELNFGIIYGMGAQSFAEAAKISKERAEQFMEEYLKDFSGIADYIQKLKDDARKNGFAVTFFGRRRYLPELNSPNYMLRSQAERMAVNMPIQGLEADIMKKAMIEIDDWIRKENYNGDLRMILQVHDELLFEVKKGLVEKFAPKIMEIMQGVIKLSAKGGSAIGGKVPIITEAKAGDNWSDMSPYKGSPEGRKKYA